MPHRSIINQRNTTSIFGIANTKWNRTAEVVLILNNGRTLRRLMKDSLIRSTPGQIIQMITEICAVFDFGKFTTMPNIEGVDMP
jgi:hypothetical protein